MRDEIFISYNHSDREWLDRLRLHLAPRLRRRPLTAWDDTKLQAGAEWHLEIQAALDRANVAVLLVSPAFLASDFIATQELPRLLSKAKGGGLRIFWVPLRASAVDETEIYQFQAAHSPNRPLAALRDAEVDEALDRVCRQITSKLSAQEASFLPADPSEDGPVEGASTLGPRPPTSRAVVTSHDSAEALWPDDLSLEGLNRRLRRLSHRDRQTIAAVRSAGKYGIYLDDLAKSISLSRDDALARAKKLEGLRILVAMQLTDWNVSLDSDFRAVLGALSQALIKELLE